jgi:hypothetical protein
LNHFNLNDIQLIRIWKPIDGRSADAGGRMDLLRRIWVINGLLKNQKLMMKMVGIPSNVLNVTYFDESYGVSLVVAK